MDKKFTDDFDFPSATKMGDFSQDRTEWLLQRARGIGGSDAGSIMGLNQYCSPLDVWALKKGLKEGFKGNSATAAGNVAEPLIRKLFPYMIEEAEGIKFEVFEPKFTFKSIAHPFQIANVDGLLHSDTLGSGVLEIKTANLNQSKKWADNQVPISYWVQVQHYMSVLDLDYAYVVCMLGNKIIWRYVQRDCEFESKMIKAEEDFAESLKSDTRPELAGYGDEGASLLAVYKKNEGEVEDETFAPLFEQLETIKEGIKALEEEKDALANRIKERIGDKKILHAGPWRGTWSKFITNRLDLDRLRAEKPDIAKEYTKSIESSTFRTSKE
jgi:putative phage-type endonuclease